MSYPPPRQSPSVDGAGPSGDSHPTPASSTHHAQSPLDWTNFLNFATPPVAGAGPDAPGMRGGGSGHLSNNGGAGGSGAGGSQAASMSTGMPGQGQGDGASGQHQHQQHNQQSQVPGRNSLGEQHYDFARGIAMNGNGGVNMNFQHPYDQSGQGRNQGQGQSQGQGSVYGVTNGQNTNQRASLASGGGNSGNGNGSNNNNNNNGGNGGASGQSSISHGKSPAHRTDNTSAGGVGRDLGASVDNGLALDPAAFSRDIRFQVPSFLSTQMGGAPSFPAGGEAWSGFSGPNFFSNDGMSNPLTPGQMFSSMFNASAAGGSGAGGSGDGRGDGSGNGMGYMPYGSGNGQNQGQGQNQAWDMWGDKDASNSGMGMGGQMGTTYYVNPNAQNMGHRGMNQTFQQQGQGQGGQQQNSRPDASPRSRPNVNIPAPINISNSNVSPAQMTAPPAPSPRSTMAQFPPDSSDHRRRATMPNVNAASGMSGSSGPGQIQQGQGSAQGSGQNGNGSMPTSALFPSFSVDAGGFQFAPEFADLTRPIASTINIASSSTAPYAPPSNTQQLLSAPIAAPLQGPSLAEGPGLYSTTGFDMVGVLARVASRKDPKTVLGPVDLSCSFAVVDVRRYDCPIVYASPTFTALTGYELPQILGRNCRFLQSPDGEVVKGSKRKYTDNVAVAHLKRMLNAGKECQASLINYRRGGIPFINLVTVVPIPWDGTDIVYHVGFQIDLVEQPNAILRNMRDGSYQVNYTVVNPPQPPMRPPGKEPTVTGLSEDVINIMGNRVNALNFGQGEEGPKMDWLKMVLENSDDFIHVLSLKGMFQYVSPSVRRVLEYEPEDLLNKNISDICHPSDIVPLMRELKDSTHAPAEGGSARLVSLVFRIRRKLSGYVWIECVGRLHVEPGKGRKAVILSGRARSVSSIPWEIVSTHGGLGETEFWAKLSFHGLILHATSGVNDMLGQPPEDVLGLSFFTFIPGGDNGPPGDSTVGLDPLSPVSTFASALRQVTSGNVREAITVSHKMLGKTGAQIDVITILYAPRARPELPARSDSEGNSSPSSSDSSSPSTASGPASHASGIRPSSIVVQIKLVPAINNNNAVALSVLSKADLAHISSDPGNAQAIAQLTNARAVAHSGSSNVFEELETTRGTSWQYELHQLRLLNRRLKEDVSAARAVGAGSKKNKKRNRQGGGGGDGSGSGSGSGAGAGGAGAGGSGGTGDMGPPPNPQGAGSGADQFAAAPRHQLAPGFGLVTQIPWRQ